jgi:Homeodomain-like domain
MEDLLALAASEDPEVSLKALGQLGVKMAEQERISVLAARRQGMSWQRIAELLGRQRSSVWERYHELDI